MRHSEDNVIVLAAQESDFLQRQPTFYRDKPALRTKTVPAGIPPRPLEVTIGTNLLVPAQRGGAALQDPICRDPYPCGQSAGSLQRVDARLNDRSDDHDALRLFSQFHHVVVVSNV